MSVAPVSTESGSKKRRKISQQSTGTQEDLLCDSVGRREKGAKQPKCFGREFKSTIFPKEHIGSPFHDNRVYIPTVKEFIADTEQGSMLDEVSLLPLEDLTSLMCGSTVYSLIKTTIIGAALARSCAELQANHAHLDLRAIANQPSIRKGSLRLLLHEGCTKEFLAPSAISAYIKSMLRCVIRKPLWKFDMAELSNRLSQRLVLARPRARLVDASFYSFKIYQLEHLPEQDFADLQKKTRLTVKEVKHLLESLLANILRFFVLYCVHGLREQILTSLSSSGEVMYQLKHADQRNIEKGVAESVEVFEKFTPLDDDYIPLLKDLEANKSSDSYSLHDQIAHLSAAQITRLILGEVLHKSMSKASPAFLVHLEEYAALLKRSQASARRRSESSVISRHCASHYIYHTLSFSSLTDWASLTKIKHLWRTLKEKLLRLKPRDSEQQLWYSQDCDHGPPELYYPLKRFAEHPHSLPKDLLEKISRRFNHFFMVYTFHRFRENVRIRENHGNLRYYFIPSPTQDLSQKTSQKCETMPLPGKSIVELGTEQSVTSVEPPLAVTEEDDDWGWKFYERVKDDCTVPAYFKTTLGILLANNRDLRQERAFLQNRLNRS